MRTPFGSFVSLAAMAGTTIFAIALALPGCGSSGDFATSPVRGKVTFNGQPVTGGSVTFRPVSTGGALAGKPASATLQADGTYVLTTYKDGDGAVVGKHELSYSAPLLDYQGEAKPGDERPKSPFDGLAPKEKQVEVKSGKNEINIELAKP